MIKDVLVFYSVVNVYRRKLLFLLQTSMQRCSDCLQEEKQFIPSPPFGRAGVGVGCPGVYFTTTLRVCNVPSAARLFWMKTPCSGRATERPERS